MTQLDPTKLPKGIRNFNPGNLREAAGPSFPGQVRDGFAVFTDMLAGTESLYWQIWANYEIHGARTLRDFIARYAPPSENDLLAYEQALCAWLRIDPKKATSFDLQLDRAWNAIDMARGLIRHEQGPTPSAWRGFPEWVETSVHSTAILRTGKWIDA
jgi:hypothetical protein